MKRLWIWVIFSLVLHFLLFRFVSLRIEPFEQNESERYEVTLLYYINELKEGEKEKPRKIRKKKKAEKKTEPEQKIEEKEEEIEEKTGQEVTEPAKEPQTAKLEKEQKTTETEPESQVVTLEKEQEEELIEKDVPGTVKVTEEVSQEPVREDELAAITTRLPKREGPPDLTPVEEPLDLTPVIEGLRERIIRELVYPYIARKKGLQGVVYVTLRLDENGNLLDIQIAKSSGHRSLDNAAVQLVQKVVPYSHNLGKSLSLEIPIRYSLIN